MNNKAVNEGKVINISFGFGIVFLASLRSEYLLTNKITVENEYFIVLNEYFKAKSVNLKKKNVIFLHK